MIMEEFTLEKWKTGDYKVITRNGRSVRIICTDAQNKDYPIIALVSIDFEEENYSFMQNGKFYEAKEDSFDLFLVKKN